MARVLRVATRGSALARAQADRVAHRLARPVDVVVVTTRGDRDQSSPIHAIGGTGVFVKEVQEAVRRGDADLAVHSAKDLPARTPDGLVLGAVPERVDPRDALVGSTLAALPTGARVATGAVRRRAQLGALRPDLSFAELRGNVPTRLERASRFDAIVVAVAALERLGRLDAATEVLAPSRLLPQVGQGALAVECRADDEDALDALRSIDDARARTEVTAERAFLGQLGGGCDLPCGALARLDPGSGGLVTLHALLASLDGRIVLRAHDTGHDPVAVGRSLARRLVDDEGGSLLLAESFVADTPGAASEPGAVR